MKPVVCSSELLNKKREQYIKLMKDWDTRNKKLVEKLARIERYAGQVRAQLNECRQEREKVRKQISRYKQMIKNKNRDDNGSEIL